MVEAVPLMGIAVEVGPEVEEEQEDGKEVKMVKIWELISWG